MSSSLGLNHVAQQLWGFVFRINIFSILSVLPLANPGNHEQPAGVATFQTKEHNIQCPSNAQQQPQ
jgi:hypothetical protein